MHHKMIICIKGLGSDTHLLSLIETLFIYYNNIQIIYEGDLLIIKMDGNLKILCHTNVTNTQFRLVSMLWYITLV